MTSSIEHTWQTPEVEEARALRERFTMCLRAIADNGGDADVVAAAVAAHLGSVTAARLPLAAQNIWRERIMRALKADGTKAMPPRAMAAIRSWPSARIGDLQAALAEIEHLLIDAENDALHEAIYAEISRHYS
jgi:hypothetical protein